MIIYNFAYTLIFPLIFFRSIYKSIVFGEKLSRNLEKISLTKIPKKSDKIILVHAVSVGEVMASRKFIEEIKSKFSDHQILITCSTQTGSQTIKNFFGNSVLHQYLPFDHKIFLGRFISYWQPEITFILETEIWPNLIDALSKKKKKVFLVNGRMSEKSYKRYKTFLPLLGKVFSKIDFVTCQGTQDKERFLKLGVDEKKINWDYSFKFDSLTISKPKLQSGLIKNNEYKIIICASTHDPEEEILIEAFKYFKNQKVILVIAPRHPERINKITKNLKKINQDYSLFSKNNFNLNFSKKINLIDEIGHLESLFSIADIAFIGGTLIPHGGQNFLEAVRYFLPISSGKSTFNFEEISNDLIRSNILKIGNSSEEIRIIWKNQLDIDFSEIKKTSEEYLKTRIGSSKRTLDSLPL
jgi:3-deoxy-D-manno-octulosonic-acid transferase